MPFTITGPLIVPMPPRVLLILAVTPLARLPFTASVPALIVVPPV